MKFVSSQSDLASSLSVVQKAVSSRTTLPILGCILVQSSTDGVDLSSTDLEIAIKKSVPAKVEEGGSVAIPARLFGDIVRSLPEGMVTVESMGGEVSISTPTAQFSINVLAPEDFPKFPEVDGSESFEVPLEQVAEVIKEVGKAVSRDETRPILTGVRLAITEGTLTMVATDSYRLAVAETKLDKQGETAAVIVPARALDEVSKLDSDKIKIALSENQVLFEVEGMRMISRLIDGQFPNYKQLLPESWESRVVVDKASLIDAVKRISLLAQNNSPLRLSISKSRLLVSATTQEVGQASEQVEVQTEGADLEIAFNAQYLLDGLMSARDEKVALEVINPLKPGVIKADKRDGFLYLIMPVRLS